MYIFGAGYLFEAHDRDLDQIGKGIFTLISRFQSRRFNEKVLRTLKPSYQIIQHLLTSKRNRDTLDMLLCKVSSKNTVLELRGTKYKNSFITKAAKLGEDIAIFTDIKKKALTARNNMTVQQQYKFHRLLLRQLKTKTLKSRISEGRGRNLKCDEFPELPALLEFAFGDGDRLERGGGGLQAHSKLYDDTMYKASDNVTVMREALDLVPSLAPDDFKISLSSLYNYTMNYKRGTHQAKQHHHGKDVNAKVSLHTAPSTGEIKKPVNGHWTNSYVNFLCDVAHVNSTSHLLDSRDAKCTVVGDIPPVLKPGHLWKNETYPDHTFDQSRNNAVTPVSHLFVETKITVPVPPPTLSEGCFEVPHSNSSILVNRSGKAIATVNLSFYEPETILRVFNDIFLLMSHIELQELFINPKTGQLKEVLHLLLTMVHRRLLQTCKCKSYWYEC